MRMVSAPELRQRVAKIFDATGAPEEVSGQVAYSLVESNLVGHDSHGVIRVPSYVRGIEEGRLHPDAEIRALRDTASSALLDCGHTFGQVGATRGMEIALEKARRTDIAIVVLRHCGHIGRLGEYVATAAEQGFMGMVFCNGSRPGGIVAPFGGIGRALGANPIAWGVPGPTGGLNSRPIFLDYATSVCAQGKIQVARDKGELLPEGWLLDSEGRPTRNPQDQFEGGVMLPFGGHKGYALGLLIELAAGGLSGVKTALSPDYEWDQGTVLVAVHIEPFQPLDEFRAMVAEFVPRIKATPRAEGCEEILLPGEPEWRSKAERERLGIPLPDRTWERLGETAQALGLTW